MIALFLLAAAVTAEVKPNCAAANTQAEMTFCAGEEFRKADAALNRQWSATATIMKGQDKNAYTPKDGRPSYYQALLDAQRAWLKYRDTQCRVEGYAMRGGSAEPMVVSGCMAVMTGERTKQLKDMMANYQQ